jgi:hypothetical protein
MLFISPFRVYAADRLNLGGVNVSLDTYTLDKNGKRVDSLDTYTDLMPLQKVPYYITVTNLKSPAWVRLKVEYDNGLDIIDDSVLSGIDETLWVKRGEYWYYTLPVETGEEVIFCDTLRIPNISNLENGLTFKVSSYAEAVQSANVSIDFSLENPFTGILIESSVNDGEVYEVSSDYDGFTILIDKLSSPLVDINFSDLGSIMPGDKVTGEITIINKNAYGVKLIMDEMLGEYLKENIMSSDNRVFQEMNLVIKNSDGKEYYNGSLLDNALLNSISLGEYPAGSNESLIFEINVPTTLENETAFKSLDMTWKFSVRQLHSGGSGGGGSSSGSGVSSTKPTSITVYEEPDPTKSRGDSGGEWQLLNPLTKQWIYTYNNSRVKNGWVYLYNPYATTSEKSNWFYFDEDGIMQYGWIKVSSGNWYFCHDISDGNLGTLQKGWHNDTDDGRVYYLDPLTGIMQSGWRQIESKWYYFAPMDVINRQNWFWFIGDMPHWVYDMLGYRTYGSMYTNEITPDGYRVDTNGVWDGVEK